MKWLVASLAVLGAGLAVPAAAQQTTPGSGTGLRMPYQAGFWGHAGLSVGRAQFQGNCFGAGNCDDTDNTWRAFAGGRFNNTFGGEVGLMHLGHFGVGGGNTKARGVDFAATAGIPIGATSSIFGKAGLAYTRSETTGTAAGLQTGKENGWGPRIGIGAQIGLSQNWALRADLDRYHIRLPGGRDDIDTFTVGVQYMFR